VNAASSRTSIEHPVSLHRQLLPLDPGRGHVQSSRPAWLESDQRRQPSHRADSPAISCIVGERTNLHCRPAQQGLGQVAVDARCRHHRLLQRSWGALPGIPRESAPHSLGRRRPGARCRNRCGDRRGIQFRLSHTARPHRSVHRAAARRVEARSFAPESRTGPHRHARTSSDSRLFRLMMNFNARMQRYENIVSAF
jgi:hypothetical protein